ncbi:MAG: glycosyltransferase family 39 protein [Deltaproteobacteria bacterium]|nr:glycosyltransferase family 39 protein [Deltaproteobacteria bacterium]
MTQTTDEKPEVEGSGGPTGEPETGAPSPSGESPPTGEVAEPGAAPVPAATPADAGRGAWAAVQAFARRHTALLLFLGALAVLLPGLSYGLWDPWETHYAEVARRVATDGDWVTLRWGNADSAPSDVHRQFLFFSKPVLTFWLMALSFLVFGVGEFAARLPLALLAAGMVGLSYAYLRRLVGPRGALLSALLLLLTPMFAMLGRHAMTDIPFVAPMTVGTLAFAAVLYDPRTGPRHAYVGYLCLGLATLAKGLLGFLLPGAALLALLFVTARAADWRHGGTSLAELLATARRWWNDRRSGAPAAGEGPSLRAAAKPWLAAAAWASLLVALAAAAGGVLARGPGVRYGALLGAAAVAVVAVLRANGDRWRRLRLPTGLPLFLAVCATWYLPVILRHRMAFVREFFLVHHFGRASTGIGLDLTGLDLHDNTSGYYLQQLGYALFPWLAALPAALVAWARSLGRRPATGDPEPADGPGGRAMFTLAVAWAAVTFVLFTTSQVKFHHYIFPAVPALAILAGVGLDRLWRHGPGRWEALALLGGAVLAVLAWRELSDDPHRLARLFSYRYTRRFPEFPWMRPVFLSALAVALAGVAAALVAAWRRSRRPPASAPRRLERAGAPVLAGTALLAAAGLTLAALHAHVPRLSKWISQQEAFRVLDAQDHRPDDRLVSWANNWRGEVFYSRDRVIVVEPGDKRAEAKLRGILRRPGRVRFITTDPRGLRGAVSRAVGAAAARDHFQVLTPEGQGGFAAAVYDGPTAERYEPRVAALPAGTARPAGAPEGRDVQLREPSGRGNLQLAGVRLGAGRVRRGASLPLDLYFRCLAPSQRDWEVFIHADGPPPARTPRVGNGDHGFTGGAVATSACRTGELLLDRWDLEIAAGVATGTYQVFAGLWHPPSGDRMRVEPESAVSSPGADAGPIEAEHADRVYLGEIVVEP